MGLEEFEKQLAEEKGRDNSSSHKSSHRHRRDEDRLHRHKHHHHHHRSHRRDEESARDEGEARRRRHRHKRDRSRSDPVRDGEKRRRHTRDESSQDRPPEDVRVFSGASGDEDEDEWVEKPTVADVPTRESLPPPAAPQRDAWMQEPTGLDVEYVQHNRRRAQSPKSQFVRAKTDATATAGSKSLEQTRSRAAELAQDFESDDEAGGEAEKPAARGKEEHAASADVSYTFGDAGSAWRLTKLKGVYRQAEESGRSIDAVAAERYGDLRLFDDAREEEREMDRRRMYGREYVGVEKPSGELFQERKMREMAEEDRTAKTDVESAARSSLPPRQESIAPENGSQMVTLPVLDATALNKLKAQLMKAKLRNAPNVAELEAEYARAEEAALAQPQLPVEHGGVVLDPVENRLLAGGRDGEVTAVSGRRGRERGQVVENEDMSIEDMVRAEKRTRRGAGEGRAFAERIAKDGKFVDNLDYLDDNAAALAKKAHRSDTHLRSAAIDDYSRTQRALANCPLCHHEDRGTGPLAPVVSLATRTYLTLPTNPEIAPGGALIVPIAHHANLLQTDEDEWEEMRNFMKSLTRHYDAQGKSVIFYEDAARGPGHRKHHAALVAVPLDPDLAATAPAYFRHALLAQANPWATHPPIIDTAALAQKPNYGRNAFRRALVPELPYFHVWYGLDGGMGHVVEDEGGNREEDEEQEMLGGGGLGGNGGRGWPRGDAFAREILGSMLRVEGAIVRRQGRWAGPGDAAEKRRVDVFRRAWAPWDWTAALTEAA